MTDHALSNRSVLATAPTSTNALNSQQVNIYRGAIQSDAVTLRILVMRVIGCHLRASRFWPRWPNRPPNRRFDG